MDLQRKSVERRHIASYIFCAIFILAFIFATWWVHLKDKASKVWWQEVKRQLSPSRIQQRLKSTRYLQDAQRAMEQGDWQKAESLLRKATEIDPNNSQAWGLLVTTLVRQEKWKEAEKLTAKIKDEKTKAETLLILADIAYTQRNWEKAKELYEQVIELDPNNAVALNNYGYMLAELGEKLGEAEKMITKAIKLRPQEPAFWDSLGWVYYQRGEYKKAFQWVEKAVKAQPHDPELRYHMGMIYWKLGDREKALKELRESVRINPHHPEANEALEQLEQEELEREMRGEKIQT